MGLTHLFQHNLPPRKKMKASKGDTQSFNYLLIMIHTTAALLYYPLLIVLVLDRKQH